MLGWMCDSDTITRPTDDNIMKLHTHLWMVALLASLLILGGCKTSTSAEAGDSSDDESSEGAEVAAEAGSAAEADEGETAEQLDSADASEGELDLPNMGRPYEGIVTAAQPSEEQFERLPEAGINTVVNLRTPEEMAELGWDEEAKAEELGLEYVNIPIGGPEDLTRDKVSLFSDVVRKEDKEILVHCSSSNRVGALFALRANWYMDATPKEALEIGRKAGLGDLEEAVRERLE